MTNHIFSNLSKVNGNDLNEIAKQCGMDFIAEKKDLSLTKNDGNPFVVPDKVAIVRTDTEEYLGTVGSGRGIVQYLESLQFTEIFAKDGSATYKYGGIIRNGSQAFLVMESADCFNISPEDPVNCYFYIQSSHDSSQALTVVPTPLRLSNNTIFIHPKLHAIKIRHSKHVQDRIAQAKQSIGKVKEYFKEFEQSFLMLATIDVSKGDILDRYLKTVFPDSKENPKAAENRRDKVKDIMLTEKSLKLPPTNGTLLGAYLAVVQFVDHYLTVKNTTGRDEVTARIESKLMVTGSGAKRKAESFSKALKLKEKLGL